MATILVVDDLPANRRFLVRLLSSQGHRLIEAADGGEGLSVAQTEHPDLVITDVLMPVIDGYELVRRLRIDPRTSGIPVMFYTAHYGEREARELALSSGGVSVLTKPIEPEEVVKSVARALSGTPQPGTRPDGVLPGAEFDREHLRLLTDKLSVTAGDLRSANARLRALINIGLEVASERDSDRLLQNVCSAARDLFGATYVTIGILALNDQTVERVVTSGIDEVDWIHAGDRVSGLLATVVSERQTLRSGNRDGDPAGPLFLLHPEVRAFLAAPIASRTRVYGWMCLVGNDGGTFDEDDEALVTALAGQVGRIYENADLHLAVRRRAEQLENEISERKQAEQALLEAGALQRAIFNSANFSSIATDAKGVIQIFNIGAERMLGYTAAEVLNRTTPADLSDPHEMVARARALSIEAGTSITPGFEALVFKASRGIEDIYELTYIRKDGSRFPAVVSVTALRDAQDAIIGYLLVGTDNTARHQVEEERQRGVAALQQSEERFRAFVTASSDVVYRMSPDWSEMRQLQGGPKFIAQTEEPSVTWFEEYIHPDDQPQVRAAISEAIRTKRTFEMEHRVRRVDGTLGWTFSRAIPRTDQEGDIIEWFGAASDVTERKLLEQTLRNKNVELEDASRMKSEFLANMSHELRTPLNAIIGFSDALREGLAGEMTDRQLRFIGDIFSSGTHLLSLINDILDLSKVEAGKMTLDLEPVQLSSLLINSLSIVKEKAAARHIGLEMDAVEDLGSMQADARKVRQIVYNLLSNAVKFSLEGGQVTLGAGRVQRGDVGRPSTTRTGRCTPLADNEFTEFIEIRVTDGGIGISAEGLEQLFKPFSQVDSGLSRKFEGTGLGLVMVKLLAELQGGAVAVESAVGGGSCFTVWLPLRPVEERAPSPVKVPVAAHVEQLSGARIALVVEDDFKAAELIRMPLEAQGFTVLHAASAEAALALAIQQPLSLITLDMLLPDMDGWEFLGRLKRIPDLRRIPVVIISIVADRNRGFALGAAAVMQKPISRRELYESFVELGLFPVSQDRTLKVLVVDDDPKAVALIAARLTPLRTITLRAYGGRDAIEVARRELPDVIVLDVMMPEVNGFDVVEALKECPDTARIPILAVTAKQITAEDRVKPNGDVTTIMEMTEFAPDRFTAQVERAMSGRDGCEDRKEVA